MKLRALGQVVPKPHQQDVTMSAILSKHRSTICSYRSLHHTYNIDLIIT